MVFSMSSVFFFSFWVTWHDFNNAILLSMKKFYFALNRMGMAEWEVHLRIICVKHML